MAAAKRRTLFSVLTGVAVGLVAVLVVVVAIRLSGGDDGPKASQTAGYESPSQAAATVDGVEVTSLGRKQLLATLEESSDISYTPQVDSYTVASDLSNVVTYGYTSLPEGLEGSIAQNGFAIDASGGADEFFEVYEGNYYSNIPSFVTTDSMMHTYHLYFQYLQKGTERDYLAPALSELTSGMLRKSQEQLADLAGTEWESAATRNVLYFSVASQLLGTGDEVPAEVTADVSTELARISAASELTESTVTGENEDYTQYAPRGYYEGDSTLEGYFRAMMWYGRINFTQDDEDLDRSALLMTMALEGDELSRWESIYTVTSFFAGASDDNGYYEYQPVLSAVYGEDAGVSSIVGADSEWASFHAATAEMKAPAINSIASSTGEHSGDSEDSEDDRGFRLMGQRFSIDASIFTQLLYSNVGVNSDGDTRLLPDALDVPAALGSDEALEILEERGATDYQGYSENMSDLRESLSDESAPIWTASLSSQWMFTLNPLLVRKGDGYPQFMQSDAWARKGLQTYLGSYTELKHDTVLYSKQPMAEMGGDELVPAYGYVEPEPELFSRLAALSRATAEGLDDLGMLSDEAGSDLELLASMADQLARISVEELEGTTPSEDEYEFIRSIGGQLEHFWYEVNRDEADSDYFMVSAFPAAVVVDVASNANGETLELGTGKVSYIYVVAPINGELVLTRGATYSFYQFEWPSSDRLTDSDWREMVNDNAAWGSSSGTLVLEDWTSEFQFA